MPFTDPKRLQETIRSFEGGVNSGVAPLLIDRNQVAWAINTTNRGGFLGNRPPFILKVIDVDSFGDNVPPFSTGYFQGSGSYIDPKGNSFAVFSVSGRIYTVALNDGFKLAELIAYRGSVQVALPFTAPNIGANVAITLTSTREIELLTGTTFAIDGASYTLVSISGNVGTFTNVNDPPATVNAALAPILLSGKPIPAIDERSATQRHTWFCQAEDQLIIQDNFGPAFIYDGVTMRRAESDEVPIGGPMAYGRGRLWVARGSFYYGGDLVWSHPELGTASVIKFTENAFLAEGGAFAVPNGPITGLAFAANLDTSLGEGDLLVFTADSVYAFQAPIDRTTWADLQYPIQRFALLDYGSLNQEAIARVNGDLFFRAPDGWRSLVYARRDFGQWGNTPISREVQRATRYDIKRLLYAGSAVNFDNRYIATVSPRWDPDHGVWHGGLVALNFDGVSRLAGNTPPAWEGVWTGMQVLQLVKARVGSVERCFAFALVDDAVNIFEIQTEGRFDFDGEDDVRIPMTIETGSFTGGSPESIKQLLTMDAWFTEIAGQVDVTVTYRNERSEKWQTWASTDFCAQYRDCEEATPPACQTPRELREIGKSRIGMPQPPDKTDPFNGGVLRDAYEFQLRLEITGHCSLRRLRVSTRLLEEDSYGDIENATCPTVTAEDCQAGCNESEWCDPDDFSHRI